MDLARGDDADKALLAELQDEQTFGAGEGRLPVQGWVRVVTEADEAIWVRTEDGLTAAAQVEFALEDGSWTYRRSAPAGCVLRRVERGVDFGEVTGATDRGQELELDVSSLACGPPPSLERVEVEESADKVMVLVRLRPPPAAEEGAGFDCAGHPPLGDGGSPRAAEQQDTGRHFRRAQRDRPDQCQLGTRYPR